MEKFHSNLSDESDQDEITTVTYLRITLKFILTKNYISILDNHVMSHG